MEKLRNKQTVMGHPNNDSDLGIRAFTFKGVAAVCSQQYRFNSQQK